ncbi:glycine oxidase ThiO [Streptomyces radicis]|uniref:glycine oxidase n=1 Tax=Streptomyces radicis TaxID=1750517 RepID=A0A3A9WMM6_9ACTN|nr:glycine oxidase ThiO [Streptomyces radicis]RKN07417.1 glycine oxidase ThiO [Streptomyces radicis]RKN19564.1 glycine oxidase ThiO [Streptomyces radicis]
MNTVVVGGGVIGLAAAWRARRAGLAVTVIDPAPGSKASHVSGGMLPAVNDQMYDQENLLRLCLASRELYPSFVAELEEFAPAGFRNDGVLDAAFDEDALGSLDRQQSFQESLGIRTERLTAAEVGALQPAFAPVLGGLLSPDDGAVDPRVLTAALITAVEALGGTVIRRAATRVADHAVVLDNGEAVAFDRLVLAAGCWTHRVDGLPQGAIPEIRPVKGQIVRLHSDPPLLAVTARALSKGSSLYLVPRLDGELVVGATYEERGYDETVTADGTSGLLARAAAVMPGVGALRFAEVSAGLRPGSPDDLPLIGPTTVPDVYLASGHFRMGVQLAPVTAEAIAAHLTDATPPAVTAPFTPLRLA